MIAARPWSNRPGRGQMTEHPEPLCRAGKPLDQGWVGVQSEVQLTYHRGRVCHCDERCSATRAAITSVAEDLLCAMRRLLLDTAVIHCFRRGCG
jgi:hypothetical protein